MDEVIYDNVKTMDGELIFYEKQEKKFLILVRFIKSLIAFVA